MMSTYQNYILLHVIVFIWGFTGILGKLISLPPTFIVWYRTAIAFLCLLLFILYKKISLHLPIKKIGKLIFIGFIISLHWIFFFASIKVSTVSVALVCISTTAFFTAILEPIFLRSKFMFYEVLLSVLTIFGIYLIFQFESQYVMGIIFSVISAFLASLFTVINSSWVKKEKPVLIGLYEMLGGFLGTTAYILLTQSTLLIPTTMDLLYLFTLGCICTSLAFVVSLYVMKELSAFTVSISVNMEPIYTILLALVLFGDEEHMTYGFYCGATVIFLTVFANSFFKNMAEKKIQHILQKEDFHEKSTC